MSRREHPDEFVRRCHWAAEVRFPSATRIATTVRRCATDCSREGCSSTTWVLKTTTGHGRNKRKLAEPIPVCLRCGEPWAEWDEVNHMATGAPGAGITKRGRWTRYQHVRGTRTAPTSREERIFGHVDLFELATLRGAARRLLRSKRRWEIRVYFAYVLHFSQVRGRGGARALATWANARANGRHRSGSWARAPFAWNRHRVATLIDQGREAWATELARTGLIDRGDWWRSHEG